VVSKSYNGQFKEHLNVKARNQTKRKGKHTTSNFELKLKRRAKLMKTQKINS
jgi:hypothetical protein